jgi:hypothetical protein
MVILEDMLHLLLKALFIAVINASHSLGFLFTDVFGREKVTCFFMKGKEFLGKINRI